MKSLGLSLNEEEKNILMGLCLGGSDKEADSHSA